MKIHEVSEKYNISMATLRYYEKIGLLDDVNRIHGIRDYQEKDIEQIGLVLNLKEAGLDNETLKEYLTLIKQGKSTSKARVCLLKKQKTKLLDTIHKQQKYIDCLDYLVYQLNKG